MHRFLAAAVGLVLCSPAYAIDGANFDGETTMFSYTDPWNAPPASSGSRIGHISFRMASIGQISSGYNTVFQVQFPSDQYSSLVEIDTEEIGGQTTNGNDCPYIQYKYENGQQTSGWEDNAYINENCAGRPDPHLFNSGGGIGPCLYLNNQPQGSNSGWLVACWDQSATQFVVDNPPIKADGNQYNVQINYYTGDPGSPPWAVMFVQRRGFPGGVTFNAADYYFDNSYNYVGDGFDIDYTGKYWEFGGETQDPGWVMYTTYLGGLAEFWLDAEGLVSANVLLPYPTLFGEFVDPQSGGAPNIGAYGQLPLGYPPALYMSGPAPASLQTQTVCVDVNSGNPTFDRNSADCGYGMAVPQEYVQDMWQMTDQYNNPNYTGFVGSGLTTASGW